MTLFRKFDRLSRIAERWVYDNVEDIQHFIDKEMKKTRKLGSDYSHCTVAYLHYSNKYIIRIYFNKYPQYDLMLNFDEFKAMQHEKNRREVIDIICNGCNIKR